MGLIHYSCNIYLLHHIHHSFLCGLFNSQIYTIFSLFLLLYDILLTLIHSIHYCVCIYLKPLTFVQLGYFLSTFLFLSVITALHCQYFAFYSSAAGKIFLTFCPKCNLTGIYSILIIFSVQPPYSGLYLLYFKCHILYWQLYGI